MARNDASGKYKEEVRDQMGQLEAEGMIHLPCKYTVDVTVERLRAILQANGVTLFLLMDHSGEAKKVGMAMPPTKLLIFGDPKAGTALMLAVRSIAIDLPLKILVWEDAEGMVWVSYNNPDYLQERHRLPLDFKKAIEAVGRFAARATEQKRIEDCELIKQSPAQ